MYKNDMYSHHFKLLVQKLNEQGEGNTFRVVTSNCNCFSSGKTFGIAREELLDTNCSVIKLPFAPVEPTRKYGIWKYYLVKYLKLNYFLETFRGFAFFYRAKGADIIHFDQVLRAFGAVSFSVLLFLSKRFGKRVVVTVHELDPIQEKYEFFIKCYNKVDKVIIFSEDFGKRLISMGVEENKMEVIPYAQPIAPLGNFKREKFIYFGGHHLLKGKGFDTLLKALCILKTKNEKIRVLIYAGECNGWEEGKEKVLEMGLDEYVTFSDSYQGVNFLYGDRLRDAYQQSIACIIPYTSGSGRHPVTAALANATPVIATRKAALPEYLGDLGIFVKEESSEELAEKMLYLLNNPEYVQSLGKQLQKRAQDLFSPDAIAKRIFSVYVGLLKS
jgi:glycosyltransferase involved in cell wall biosynthesis